MRYFVTLPSHPELAVEVGERPGGSAEVTVEGHRLEVEAIPAGDALCVQVQGRIVELWLAGRPPDLDATVAGARLAVQIESARSRLAGARSGKAERGASRICAPMPGRVVKVLVGPGDEARAGVPAVVVEAMKMENELCPERSGRVAKICVEAGQNVEGGAVLVELE